MTALLVDPVLPDVIEPGLRVVFCGSAVGAASARVGAYYAGPGNKFWPTLHAIGLTPRRLKPTEYASVVEYGLGLTDLSKWRSGSDVAVGTDDFDVQRLEDLVRRYAPRVIAFNGVKAGRAALGGFESYGRRLDRFGDAEAWVLSSTSGAANRWWDAGHWHDLGERLRRVD